MFRRENSSPAEPTAAAPAAPDMHAGGKGRPTPTRKEAEAARRERRKPTMTKREARKRARDQSRVERNRAYEGLRAGDERYFPLRDQGPVRRYIRDVVDGRRLFTEFFLPVMIVILMASLLPFQAVVQSVTLLWLVAIALVLSEMVWLWFRIKGLLRAKFPADQWGRSDLFYGVMRATQLRRLRLPRPVLKPGQPTRD